MQLKKNKTRHEIKYFWIFFYNQNKLRKTKTNQKHKVTCPQIIEKIKSRKN